MMGLLQSYSSFIVAHPGKIIFGTISLILSLLAITILIKPLPSFRDPRVGIEARDTLISSRLNTWKLLVDESSANRNNLSLNPNSAHYEIIESYHNEPTFNTGHMSNELNNSIGDGDGYNPNEPPIVEMSLDNVYGKSSKSTDLIDEDEEEYYKNIKSEANNAATLMHYSLDSNQAFCGQLFEGYAQVVIYPSARQSQNGLLNLNSMISICQLDHKLRLELTPDDRAIFQDECERFQINNSMSAKPVQQEHSNSCCNSWSLPNYVACLSNQTSCFSIEPKDIKIFENLLHSCAPYYYKSPYEECFVKQREAMHDLGNSNFNLLNSPSYGFDRVVHPRCGHIPDKCLRCGGWTFNVMHYLVNNNLMQSRNDSGSGRHNHRFDRYLSSSRINATLNKLTHTNIFLPMAKSPSLMNYYQALSRYQLKTPFAYVKAMDLGLKNILFERLLSDDAKLFLVALFAILVVITIHTWSIVLSGVIMLIICLSLCMSFMIYEVVLDIPIFPFMNLLAIVISFGICSDNAMLFCKQWSIDREIVSKTTDESQANEESIAEHRIYIINIDNHQDVDKNKSDTPNPTTVSKTDFEQNGFDYMLKRAILGTSVATLATACSFVISAISKITAIRCFCIFATLSVITNYLLLLILLPPALIINSKFSILLRERIAVLGPRFKELLAKSHLIRNKMLDIGKTTNNSILEVVARSKYYLIITFVTLLCCSSILVFYRPTLQPADDDHVQLLSTQHAFEQYDRHVKKNFGFEMVKDGSPLDTLPIRVVFGVEHLDNGDIFDTHDKGHLIFDSNFDVSDPKAQTWMLDFCKKLKLQRFIKQNAELEYSNCFIETFKSWMERPCHDPVQPEIDRSPCCLGYEFPFSKATFNKCVGEAVKIIRKTPQSEPNTNAGVRFFKNSTQIAAIVIEYQSNRLFSSSYKKMDRFFSDVDAWVSWQINNTAPPTLKSGWFISNNLEWLALQNELLDSTTTSIILEVLFAMIALLLSTRDVIITIVGTITIVTIITMTVASLIMLKWTLGVAESIMISLTIGLSIDFALHYSVAYSESKSNGSNHAIIHSVFQQVGGPIALATITTSVAGFVIIWSDILAYQELGVFLILIAMLSWMNSTFFLLPMLASIDQLKLDNINIFDARQSLNGISKFIRGKL